MEILESLDEVGRTLCMIFMRFKPIGNQLAIGIGDAIRPNYEYNPLPSIHHCLGAPPFWSASSSRSQHSRSCTTGVTKHPFYSPVQGPPHLDSCLCARRILKIASNVFYFKKGPIIYNFCLALICLFCFRLLLLILHVYRTINHFFNLQKNNPQQAKGNKVRNRTGWEA